MKRILVVVLALALVTAATGLAGCRNGSTTPGSNAKPQPATPATSPTAPATSPVSPAKQTDVLVYLVRGERLGVGGRRVAAQHPDAVMVRSAIEALVAGPTDEERGFGLLSTIPSGTVVNGVSIKDGVATIDLSKRFESGGGSLSMLLRVAQVVYTATQFDGVDKVAFKLDGTPAKAIGGEGIIVSPPVTRADFEGQVPAILVENPVPGAIVSSPITISGTANVFEAQFTVNITDPEGLIIAEKTVMATRGTGERGTFSLQLPFTSKRAGLGAVIAFEPSPKDGKPTNVVEVPVRLAR